MNPTTEVPRQARRIGELLGKLEGSGDRAAVATARELVEGIMDLHGAGLERMIAIIARAGASSREILDSLGRDGLVSSLLVLYGLHPDDLETRVRRALEKFPSRGRPHTGEVELISIEEGVVRLRLRAGGSGCGSNGAALQSAVEEALYGAAPDLTRLILEGVEETEGRTAFVPLAQLTGPAEKGAAL